MRGPVFHGLLFSQETGPLCSSRARSVLVRTWLRSPPFSHPFMQNQTRTSKEPYGIINAHNVGVPQGRHPAEGPRTFCEDAAELHGDILQSFLVRAKCEKQQYITLR